MMTRDRCILYPDWAGRPVDLEIAGWPVVERFDSEGGDPGTGLADLSHRPKAVLYGPGLKTHGELRPGQASWTGQGFTCLLKPGEAVVFDLLGTTDLVLPREATDMTEAWVLLGLWGTKAVEVLQRLFSLDVDRPAAKEPFYVATRWHALTVQIVNLKTSDPGFLLSTDRSHGLNLYDGLIHAGRPLGLKPAGLKAWQGWFNKG